MCTPAAISVRSLVPKIAQVYFARGMVELFCFISRENTFDGNIEIYAPIPQIKI